MPGAAPTGVGGGMCIVVWLAVLVNILDMSCGLEGLQMPSSRLPLSLSLSLSREMILAAAARA